MKNNWKTLLSLVLVLTMVVSPLSSASAFAAEDEAAQTTAIESAPIIALSEESANTEDGNGESEITRNDSAAMESGSVAESPSTIKKEEEKPLDKEDEVKTEESENTEEKETVDSKEQDEKSENSAASESEKVLPEVLTDIALMTDGDETENTANKDTVPSSDVQLMKADGSTFSMFIVSQSTVTVKGDNIEVFISTDNTGYNKLYLGSKDDEVKDPVISGVEKSNGGWEFTFTIPLEKKGTNIPVCLGSKKGTWYTKADLVLTIPDVKVTDPDSTPTPTPTPVPGTELENGVYNAPTVTTNASMFKVVNCQLTSKNGKLTAEIALSGTGYDYLYMGTGEEAATDSSKWISYTVKDVLNNQTGNMESKYVYEIPVSALDTPISVAAHSSSKNLWYDRTITISSEGLTKTGDLPTDPTKPTPTPSVTPTPIPTNPETNGGTTKPTGNDGKAEEESKYESDLSGSTGAVDSTTGLKDGVYVPDSFTWSGGTGKVSISCNKVTVKNGQAYATIVFSSSSYSYVKANGRKYYATISGNSSSFTIPVALNKNNTIIGMTIKMSAAHEIAYNIYVYLAAAAKADGTGSGTNSDVVIGLGQGNNNKLDEEAPQIIGLTYESETRLDYAEYFKLYHYQDGISLLEVDMTKDTVRDPEKLDDKDKATDEDKAKSDSKKDFSKSEEAEEVESKAADAETEEGAEAEAEFENEKAAELYMGNVVKYLLVPENTEIPVGLEKEVIVVNLPVDKTYVASEEALSVMDELELPDMIRALGFEKEDCPIDEFAEAMEKDEIRFAGTYDDVDYKALLKAQCDMSIMPSDLLPREEADDKDSDSEETLTVEEQTERLQEIAEHSAMLEIPMLIDRSADEETELAQYEWIKVYGVIFGCESKTEKLFNQAVKDAEKRTANEK